MTPTSTKKRRTMHDADRSNGLIPVDATRLAMPKDLLEDSSQIRDLNKRRKGTARLAKEIEEHDIEQPGTGSVLHQEQMSASGTLKEIEANVERRNGNGLVEDMDSN